MSTFTKQNPNGSTSGAPVNVAATATPGTLFHTASATGGVQDEIYMYLTNTDTVEHKVTVEFGGATDPDDHIVFPVPAGDTILAIAGVPLTGGLAVKAYADTANKVNMFGFVNRIS